MLSEDLNPAAELLFNAFFSIPARDDNLTAAAAAFQPEIRAGPDHFPVKAPARMLLLQCQEITFLYIHFLYLLTEFFL